jgi:hypothetical protein
MITGKRRCVFANLQSWAPANHPGFSRPRGRTSRCESIAYLNVGSGIYLAEMIKRLGISDAIESKIIRPDTDIVSEVVAKGEVEFGMVITTQILTTPGVQLAGPLPSQLQSYVCLLAP